MRNRDKYIIALLTVLLVFAFSFPVSAQEKTKIVSKSFNAIETERVIKKAESYGTDNFKLSYCPKSKTIQKCIAKQKTNIALKKGIIVKKGGIKVRKHSKRYWEYANTWYINFSLLPKKIKQNVSWTNLPNNQTVKVVHYYKVTGCGVIKRTKSVVTVIK